MSDQFQSKGAEGMGKGGGRRVRRLDTEHPVHGKAVTQISADAAFEVWPFEDWGLLVKVKGPTEDFTIETVGLVVSAPEEIA